MDHITAKLFIFSKKFFFNPESRLRIKGRKLITPLGKEIYATFNRKKKQHKRRKGKKTNKNSIEKNSRERKKKPRNKNQNRNIISCSVSYVEIYRLIKLTFCIERSSCINISLLFFTSWKVVIIFSPENIDPSLLFF